MFKAMGFILRDSFYTKYNGIIFYLQRIPLIKKLISDKFYKINFLDKAIIFFGVLFEFIWSILKKIIYYFAIKFFISWIFGDFDLAFSKKYLLYFMIVLSITGFMYTIEYFKGNQEDYIFVKLMRLSAKDYYSGKIYYEVIFNIISYTIVFGIAFIDLGFSFIDAFSYATFLFGLRILHILKSSRSYRKNRKIRNRINNTKTFILIILPAVFLVYLIVNLLSGNHLFFEGKISYSSIGFFIISLITMGLASFLFFKTERINEASKKALRKDLFDIDIDEIRTQNLGIDEKKDKVKISSKNFEKYSGIEYINRIFFDRFNKKFFKPIRTRAIIVFLLMLGLNLFVYLLKLGNDKDLIEFASDYLPLVGFLAGLYIYIGDRFTRLCFFNMDRFLMKNNFYRRPVILKEAIKIRFKKMISYNLPMLIIFLLGSAIFLYQMGASLLVYILTLVFAILGMGFFNFHFLYSYYLLQPFTEQMEVKNPVYSILNIFAYFIVLGLISLINSYKEIVMVGILIFCLIYIILGYFLVTKYAYKRFKLR